MSQNGEFRIGGLGFFDRVGSERGVGECFGAERGGGGEPGGCGEAFGAVRGGGVVGGRVRGEVCRGEMAGEGDLKGDGDFKGGGGRSERVM